MQFRSLIILAVSGLLATFVVASPDAAPAKRFVDVNQRREVLGMPPVLNRFKRDTSALEKRGDDWEWKCGWWWCGDWDKNHKCEDGWWDKDGHWHGDWEDKGDGWWWDKEGKWHGGGWWDCWWDKDGKWHGKDDHPGHDGWWDRDGSWHHHDDWDKGCWDKDGKWHGRG